jgi:hypothetical protein
MKIQQQNKVVFAFICLAYFIVVWLIKDNQLFWDTVQFGGKHPNYFYKHPYNFILPPTLDSGHIPAFGYYISMWWQVFGRSLSVTHWAMLPFLIGMAYQIYLFIKRFSIPSEWSSLALLFILCDPTLLAQSILVSPDICLVFFFFLLLNSIQSENKLFIVLAALGLVLTSNRGVLVVASVGIWALIQNFQKTRKLDYHLSFLFAPSALLFIWYHFWHYQSVGWVFYHDLSPWAPCFAKASGMGILKNSLLFIHRTLDFGRIFLVVLLFVFWRKIGLSLFEIKGLLSKEIGIVVLLIVFLGYPFITHVGLSGHRYILPVILMLELLWLRMLFMSGDKSRFIYILGLFSLLTGHLWKYPLNISQGWDASLNHIGFYQNQKDFYKYINKGSISPSQVTSTFPLVANHFDQFISEQDAQLTDNDKTLTHVLISDLASKFQLDTIENYTLNKEFSHFGLNFYLYKRK